LFRMTNPNTSDRNPEVNENVNTENKGTDLQKKGFFCKTGK